MLVPSRDTVLKTSSGSVASTDPLVAFLYDLMRDFISPGDVEKIIESNYGEKEFHFSNGWLANYAKNIVEALRETQGGPKVGDLVCGFADGPTMPVTEIKGNQCTCTWVAFGGEPQRAWFNKNALTLAMSK